MDGCSTVAVCHVWMLKGMRKSRVACILAQAWGLSEV